MVVGSSVTALPLPRYCGSVSDLVEDEGGNCGDEQGGRLIYIIGGELEELVESRIVNDVPIDKLLQRATGTSDKRSLIFNAWDV